MGGQPLTLQRSLLTANGKLAINQCFHFIQVPKCDPLKLISGCEYKFLVHVFENMEETSLMELSHSIYGQF